MDEQIALIEKAGISNENDEWYTPKWVFDALGIAFDLDPCSPGAPPLQCSSEGVLDERG